MRYSSSSFLIACGFIAACGGETLEQTRSAASTSDGANLPTLAAPGGTRLSFELDGLTERVNEFNGVLNLSLDVMSLPTTKATARYSSADTHHLIHDSDDGEALYTILPRPGGLASRWSSNWFGRYIRERHHLQGVQVGQGAAIAWRNTARQQFEYPDGRLVQRMLPAAEDAPFAETPGMLGMADGSTFAAVTPEIAEIRTTSGVRYRLSHRVGADGLLGWAGTDFNAGSEGFYATFIEDLHGNATRIQYYGDSDAATANNTPFPRVVESLRRLKSDGAEPEYAVTARAFFYISADGSNLEPGIDEPDDVLTGLDQHSRIVAIRFPGPQSTQTLTPEGNWAVTRFEYGAGRNNLAAISRGEERFEFDYFADPGWEYGSPSDNDRIQAGRVRDIRFPGGASVHYEWAKDKTPLGWCDPDDSDCFEDLFTLRGRTLHEAVKGRDYRWVLNHRAGSLPNGATGSGSTHNTTAVAVVSYPDSGEGQSSSSVLDFGPVHKLSHPESAKSGRVLRARHYATDVWDHNANALSTDSIRPTATEETGYATFFLGLHASWYGIQEVDFPGEPEGVRKVWTAFPTAQVTSMHEETASDSPCCWQGYVDGESFACESVFGAPQDGVTCCLGDEPLAQVQNCTGDPSCYTVTLGGLSISCAGEQSCSPASLICTGGTSCNGAANCAGTPVSTDTRSVVSIYRNPARRTTNTLKPMPLNGTQDYDGYGNVPFTEVFETTDVVRFARSASDCESGECKMKKQGDTWIWDCDGEFTCQNDGFVSVPRPLDPSTFRKFRPEYQIYESDRRDAYVSQNLVRLVSAQSLHARNGTELSRVETDFDFDRASYPYDDTPCDLSDAVRGRPTRIRSLNFEDPSATAVTYACHYGLGEGLEPLGAMGEQAVKVTGALFRRTRLGYAPADLSVGFPSHPTSIWEVRSSAKLLAENDYNASGQLIRTRDINGTERRFSFDGRGRPVGSFLPEDSDVPTLETQYHTPSDPSTPRKQVNIERGDASEQRAYTFYDTLGREIQSRAPSGINNQAVVQERDYWRATHKPLRETEPFVRTLSPGKWSELGFERDHKTNAYDGFGRVVRRAWWAYWGTIPVLDRETTVEYGDRTPGLVVNQIRTTDPQGSETIATHDAFGRVLQTQFPDGTQTKHSFSPLGPEASTRHPDGLESNLTLNSQGTAFESRRPESGLTYTSYYASGETKRTTRANGRSVRRAYDHRGRLRTEWVRSHPGIPETARVRYVYDAYPNDSLVGQQDYAADKITRVEFGENRYEYGYDVFGRVVEFVADLEGLPTKRIYYNYDKLGHVLGYVYEPNTPDEQDIQFVYDAAYRPVELHKDGAKIHSSLFDSRGRMTERTLWTPSGDVLETVSYGYNRWGRLTHINDVDDIGDKQFALHVGYDDIRAGASPRKDGQPSFIEWVTPGHTRAAYLLQYDDARNLVSADFEESPSGGPWIDVDAYDFTAGYNAVGGPTTLSRTDEAGTANVQTRNYDPNTRRLMSLEGDDEATFKYDAAGQMIRDGRWGPGSAVRYTPGGMPSLIQDASTRYRFSYDPNGNRVRTRRYSYRKSGCAYAEDSVEPVELDAPRGGPAVSSRGCFELDRDVHHVMGADGAPLAQYQNGDLVRWHISDVGYEIPTDVDEPAGVYYQLRDHLGSPRVALREDGTVASSVDYGPFGLPLEGRNQKDDALTSREGFGTYDEFDDFETPISHAQARLYDPTVAQFWSPDPLAGQDPVRSAYVYANNRPFSTVDPSGLTPEDPASCPIPAPQSSADGTQVNAPTSTALDASQTIVDVDLLYNGGNLPTVTVAAPMPDDALRINGQLYAGRLLELRALADERLLNRFIRGEFGEEMAKRMFMAAWHTDMHETAKIVGEVGIWMLSMVGGAVVESAMIVRSGMAQRTFYAARLAEAQAEAALIKSIEASWRGGTNVCRGGSCTAHQFSRGKGVVLEANGTVSGISVNVGNHLADDAGQLLAKLTHKKGGVSVINDIKAAGGSLRAAPIPGNEFHALLRGISPQRLEAIFKSSIIRNPRYFTK